MTLRDYFDVLRKRWLVVAAVALVGLIGGAVIALTVPSKYEATAQLYVSVPVSDSAVELNQASTYLARELTSYAALATTPLVLEPVTESDDTDQTVTELQGMLEVTNPTATSLLEVTASAQEPEDAADLANAVAEELTHGISTVSPQVQGEAGTVEATLVSRAQAPNTTSGLPLSAYPAIGLAAGLVVGMILALLIDGLDNRPRTVSDLHRLRGAPALATIPRLKRHSPVLSPAAQSDGDEHDRVSLAQPFVSLRAHLQRSHPEVLPNAAGSAVFLVTGSRGGDGASTTALGLARSFAHLGSRVVLVDAHLTDGGITDLVGQNSRPGIVNIVSGLTRAEECVVELEANLRFLPAGDRTNRPSDVACSQRLRQLIGDLSQEFDVVIIDCASAEEAADGAVLASACDSILLVTVPGRTATEQLQATVDVFGDRPVHIVANRAGHPRNAAARLT